MGIGPLTSTYWSFIGVWCLPSKPINFICKFLTLKYLTVRSMAVVVFPSKVFQNSNYYSLNFNKNNFLQKPFSIKGWKIISYRKNLLKKHQITTFAQITLKAMMPLMKLLNVRVSWMEKDLLTPNSTLYKQIFFYKIK